MREDERCERCDYERLELVDAAAYDAALAASQSAVRQAQACLPVLRSLADSEPGEGGWQEAFVAAQRAAQTLLPELAPSTTPDIPEPDPEVVWRCRVCGAVDAPQECLGICLWHRFEWVPVDRYATARSDATSERARADAVAGLVRLLAATHPRQGTWRPNWLALQHRARALLDG